MPAFTTRHIADQVTGKLEGADGIVIRGVDQLKTAGSDQISFIRDGGQARFWPQSAAGAALVTMGVEVSPGLGRALIFVDDADLALAKVLGMFAPPVSRPEAGIHTSAVVAGDAEIGQGVAIGPYCTVGPRARIAAGCVLHAGVSLSSDVVLGERCELFAGVVVRERCELGHRVVIHANSVIGSDGFGYRPVADGSGLVKVPQIGSVTIGDDVEIGSGTCVDRGKFAATTIGDGTKIDNLCQIAHNCQIGRCCILVAQVGLAGGVTVGDGAVLGGQAGVAEHITIGRGARIAAQSGVMQDVPEGATWAGVPAREARAALREHLAVRRLPKLLKELDARD